MIIEGWQFEFTKVVDHRPPKPYQYAYLFVKNNQTFLSDSLKDTHQTLADFLDQKSLNYSILLLEYGYLVFTETAVDLDPLVTKLVTGINFEGEIPNMSYQVGRANRHITREKNPNDQSSNSNHEKLLECG